MTLKTEWLGSFAWKATVWTTKVMDETFRNGKDMKIKYSASSSPIPPVPFFFLKKALYGETNFFGQIY